MPKTPSNMIPLGTTAPSFTLIDTLSGKEVMLDQFKSANAIVVMFICNHCPYVKWIIDKVVQIATDYQKKGVAFIAISSNDAAQYPDDSPDNMLAFAKSHQFTFPYLYDDTQAIAKAYQAACTPDFYVFDQQMACVYRGRFDDATPGNEKPVTGQDLSDALDHLLDHKPIQQDQLPSVGCNIKWKLAL